MTCWEGRNTGVQGHHGRVRSSYWQAGGSSRTRATSSALARSSDVRIERSSTRWQRTSRPPPHWADASLCRLRGDALLGRSPFFMSEPHHPTHQAELRRRKRLYRTPNPRKRRDMESSRRHSDSHKTRPLTSCARQATKERSAEPG